jgi:hypothetical protein
VLGVDGLDYIQGIPLKLLAFERFLEQHPQMVKEVVLVQVRGGFRLSVRAVLTGICLCEVGSCHEITGRTRLGQVGYPPDQRKQTKLHGSAEYAALQAEVNTLVVRAIAWPPPPPPPPRSSAVHPAHPNACVEAAAERQSRGCTHAGQDQRPLRHGGRATHLLHQQVRVPRRAYGAVPHRGRERAVSITCMASSD